MAFSTTQLSIDELKSEFRDFKIRSINGDLKFDLRKNISSEISDKLDFIIHTFPNDVISGSLSLYLIGLLGRKPNDIDIVIPDNKRYTHYALGSYDDEFSTPNRLGIRTFKYKKNFFFPEITHEVDFFENKDASFINFIYNKSQIKIHNPLEVMQHKLEIIQNKNVARNTQRKHNEDLTQIFGQSVWQLALKKFSEGGFGI